MSRLILLLFLLLAAGRVCGQSFTIKQLDSLNAAINKYTKKDSVFIKMELEYAKEAIYLKPSDTAILPRLRNVIRLSEDLRYHKGVALAHIRAGVVYSQFLSNPHKALDHYNASLRSIESDPSLNNYKADVLNNIAVIYFEQQDYSKAIKYYKNALQFLDEKKQFMTYAGMANVYTSMKQYEKAIHAYQQALQQTQKDKNHLYSAVCLSNMSLALLELGRVADATKAIEEALALIDLHQLEYARSMAYLNAAMVYKAKGDLALAENYALKALNMQGSVDNNFVRKSVWGTLAEVYESRGQYQKALQAYRQYMTASDSLNSEDRKSEITRKMMQYEYEKNSAVAKAELRKQKVIKNTILIAGLFLAAMAMTLFLVSRKNAKEKQLRKDLLVKAQLSDVELRILRLQLNPHFIFNSLNSIADYISKNNIESADYYLAKFAKLMRGILENSEEKEIPIAEEISMLKLYMELEAMRLNNKFSYEIRIAEGINPETTMIPPLILQPFVENSIWHGLAGKESEGKIIIEVTRDNDMLQCVVQDNGVGRSAKAANANSKSYGMKISRDRVNLLNKLKNTNAGVHIVDLEKGTRVEVTLPFDEER